ncbi:MAG: hypothetical protein KFF73_04265 [Cyclobacteriaceae bacterium]|nr:hypothetical protein [Cyclobacteriaceae bacterium]
MILDMDLKKIRIFSKKLSSGNCQVKFFIDSSAGKPYYGYMLATPGQKVSEVITHIYQKVQDIEDVAGYPDQKKAGISHKRYVEPGFMLFEDNTE